MGEDSNVTYSAEGSQGYCVNLDVLRDAILAQTTKERSATMSSNDATISCASSVASGDANPPQRTQSAGSDQSSTTGAASGQNKGRFSKHEKKVLFGLIREDPGLFHAFLHQRKERMYGTKSWMHEIAKRYNDKAEDKRSLEAIRHHLMFRKSSSSRGDKHNNDNLLFEHARSCQQAETCTKCLIFQRLCVQKRIAHCGYDLCSDCDKSQPHVSSMLQGLHVPKSSPRALPGLLSAALPLADSAHALQRQLDLLSSSTSDEVLTLLHLLQKQQQQPSIPNLGLLMQQQQEQELKLQQQQLLSLLEDQLKQSQALSLLLNNSNNSKNLNALGSFTHPTSSPTVSCINTPRSTVTSNPPSPSMRVKADTSLPFVQGKRTQADLMSTRFVLDTDAVESDKAKRQRITDLL